jgi:hypothetical protein
MRHAIGVLAVAAAFAALGCAGGGAPSGPRPDPNLLEAAEIASSNLPSMLEVIRSRRPRWLQRSAMRPTALGGPQPAVVVYLDGQRFGGPESLAQIIPASVDAARYLTPSEAQARFGSGNLAGVILIETRPSSSGS